MAIVVPQFNPGAYIGQGFSQGLEKGVSSGLEALQKLHMEDMLARQQQTRIEKSLEPLFQQVEGTPYEGVFRALAKSDPKGLSKMVQTAILGGFNFGEPQQTQDVPAEEYPEQSVGTSENMFTQRKTPTPTRDFGEALRRGIYETPQLRQARELEERREAFTSKENLEKDKRREQRAKSEQAVKFAKDIEPWLKNEDAVTNNIHDMANIADRGIKALEQIGRKNYPGMAKRWVGDVTAGWVTPSLKEFYNIGGELALAKASALKGQPTNFKIKLVQSIKPGLSSDYKTNMRMLRRYKEVAEARDRRQAFRDNLKEDGQFPANIQSIMSEYDNAMADPKRHKKFFEKYPSARDDAYFLSEDYENKKMREEDRQYGMSKPTKPLDQLEDREVLDNPDWFKVDTVYEDNDGKSHRIVMANGIKKWKAVS